MPLRVLTIKEATDVKSLGKSVLASRLSAAQSDSALASLAATNPHLDLTNIPAGTVLIIPDAPSFKPTVGDAVHDDSFAAFEKIVKAGQTSIGQQMESAAGDRRTERAAVAAAIKLAVVQRLVKSDAALKTQVDATTAAMKTAQEDDAATAKAFDAVAQEVADALDALRKLIV
jgi:hypothetical protein